MTVVGEAFVAIKPETSAFAADTQAAVQGAGAAAGQQFSSEFSAALDPSAAAGFAAEVADATGGAGTEAGEQFGEQFADGLDVDADDATEDLAAGFAEAGDVAAETFGTAFSEALAPPDVSAVADALGEGFTDAGADAGGLFTDGLGDAFSQAPDTDSLTNELVAEVAASGADAGEGFASGFNQTLVDAGLAAGAAAIVANAIGEFDEAQRGIAATNAVLQSTGLVAGVTADHVEDLATAGSKLAAIDDELVRGGINVLLRFTSIRNEVEDGTGVFDRATTVLLDMAAALGRAPADAAVLLGKALDNPIRGITILGRVVGQFTDQQKDLIRGFVETGDVASAQGVILDALEAKFAGQAEAQATGLARIKVASGELGEAIGGALAPAVEGIVPVFEGALSVFEAIPGPLQTVTVGLLGVAALAGPVSRVVGLISQLNQVSLASRAGSLVTGLAGGGALLTPVIGAFGLLTTAVLAHRDAQQEDEEATEALSQAIAAQSGDLEQGTLAFLQRTLEDRGVLDDLNRTGIGLEEVRNRMLGGATAARSLGIELGETDEHFRNLPVQVERVRRNFADLTAQQINAGIATGDLNRDTLESIILAGEQADGNTTRAAALRVLNRLLEDGSISTDELAGSELGLLFLQEAVNDAMLGTESAATSSADALEDLQPEVEETGVQALTAAERIDAMTSALSEFFAEATRQIDAGVAFRESLRDVAEAGAEVAEEGLTGQERIDAFLRVVSRGVGDIDAFAASLIEQGATTEEVVAQTNAMVDELFAAADQAGLTAAEVDFLRASYGLLPEQVETEIVTNAAEVGADLDALLAKARLFREQDFNINFDTRFGGPRAGGGPVWPGGSFLVGEEGRELFVPDTAGTILPADVTAGLGVSRDDLLAFARAMAAGTGQTIETNHFKIIGATAGGAFATAAEVVAAQRRSRYRRAGLR